MKQKLPKKKYLYKNLDLDEIQKIQNLGNRYTKWSLIRLLIAIFSNKRNFSTLLDFQILTSLFLRDLYNSKKKKKFLLNILVFLTLPFFVYILINKNIVEQQNFDFLKIQKQNFIEKNNKSILKKNFCFLNTKFDIFLHNFFSLKKKKMV